MCTAVTYETKDFYFGRTLDYDFSYGEEVVITPRHYCFHFRNSGVMHNHYAMIGMAHVTGGYPLYYEAVNEKGLGMAGLNFVGNAVYFEAKKDRCNVATYELIPWILGQCATVGEAQELLKTMNIINTPFNEKFPVAQLHWMISGHGKSITVESTEDGLHIYDNPMGVLTNNPPFPEQAFALNNYMGLSVKSPTNHFCAKLPLHTYSRGMGALGLPGDLSSQSRFVRASFVKMNSVSGTSERESVNQFFHIMGSVGQPRGCCDVGDGQYEITVYTSCCNTTKGIYYYTTYENFQIVGVDMHREDLDCAELIRYPLLQDEQIRMQN